MRVPVTSLNLNNLQVTRQMTLFHQYLFLDFTGQHMSHIDKYKAYVIRQCYYFPVSNANSSGWQNINIGHSGVWKVCVNYFAPFHVFHMYIDLIIVDLLI